MDQIIFFGELGFLFRTSFFGFLMSDFGNT